MKKILIILLVITLIFSLSACQDNEDNAGTSSKENEEIRVGVAFYPMKDILDLIEDDLKEDGYELKIEEFSDYQTPNNLLKNEELDANMIQHSYFLQEFNKANDSDLVTVQPIYHATFALYSKEYESLDEIPDGTSITMPDDSTNFSRALHLLGQAKLLTFKDDKKIGLTVDDIDNNPKNLKLEDKVPLTSLAQRYEETGIGIMYPTYAKSLELEGDEERLYVEKQDNVTEGYAISLVSRSDNKNSEKIKALAKHIASEEVKQFLIDNYDWASRPAF